MRSEDLIYLCPHCPPLKAREPFGLRRWKLHHGNGEQVEGYLASEAEPILATVQRTLAALQEEKDRLHLQVRSLELVQLRRQEAEARAASAEAALQARTETQIAETIARLAHAGQTTRSEGLDYITHPAAVAALLPDDLKPAGWLHDVIEDSLITAEALRAAGISDRTVDIVRIVSRIVGETYVSFIRRIASSENIGAIQVKLADLRHNLRPSCPDPLRARYVPAVAELEAALAPVGEKGEARSPVLDPPQYPFPLNAEQEKAVREWAADDRLWTTEETVRFNLRVFARKILAALPAPPLAQET